MFTTQVKYKRDVAPADHLDMEIKKYGAVFNGIYRGADFNQATGDRVISYEFRKEYNARDFGNLVLRVIKNHTDVLLIAVDMREET